MKNVHRNIPQHCDLLLNFLNLFFFQKEECEDYEPDIQMEFCEKEETLSVSYNRA